MSEYSVWVEFDVLPEHLEEFRDAVLKNAKASVATEPGCLRFDVLDAVPAAPQILLYEIYVSEAAFKAHLETDHFRQFDQQSAPWVVRKAVQFGNVTQISKT